MNNIAKERQALGLTQEQLAKLFGWRQSRLSNYENGTRQPGLAGFPPETSDSAPHRGVSPCLNQITF